MARVQPTNGMLVFDKRFITTEYIAPLGAGDTDSDYTQAVSIFWNALDKRL